MTLPSRNLCNALRGACFVLPWLIQLFAADVCLSALLPLSYLSPRFVYDVSSRLANSVWHAVQLIFTWLNGATITVSGSGLPRHESAVVVANHLSWTDFYMIQALAIKAGMLGRCRWFAKQQLKWVPFLGWGLWAMGMPLVSRNWMRDRTEIDNVFGTVICNKLPIWLISYSEATRLTSSKFVDTVQWCKSNDKPLPKHTLYPRTRGFVATVNHLRKSSHIRAVYDVTIAYAKGNRFLVAPTFWETLSCPMLSSSYRFHVHVDRHALEELPDSSEDLAKWLEDRWVYKNLILEGLRDKLMQGQPWGEELA